MSKSEKVGQKNNFRLKNRLKSFRYAFNGIGDLLRYEHNARIHLVILMIVVITGLCLGITGYSWMAIMFVAGLVFVSECFNTAIEYISDEITGEPNENIRRAKDVAAAGVLISAIISVITGLVIFLPEVISLAKK